jgi:hypothetical protein
MIQNFEQLKQQLSELSPIVNSFKSETVQLRVIELVFAQAAGIQESSQTAAATFKPASPPAAKARKRKASKAQATKSENSEAKPVRSKGGRPGPGAIVEQLIGEGFFNKGKTPNDVVIHCRDDKVLTYNGTEISVSLARAVKSQKLKREKDGNGQFLYIKR